MKSMEDSHDKYRKSNFSPFFADLSACSYLGHHLLSLSSSERQSQQVCYIYLGFEDTVDNTWWRKGSGLISGLDGYVQAGLTIELLMVLSVKMQGLKFRNIFLTPPSPMK